MKENNDKLRTLLEAAMPDVLMLKDMMEANDIPIQEIMRAVFLASNVKKLSQWGRVILTIKNGEIVTVSQEQQFITQREMERTKR